MEQRDEWKEQGHVEALIREARVVMLTTEAPDGTLRSRPMAVLQDRLDDGCLWFFTERHSGKTDEVRQEHQVCVAYASPEKESYLSISGTAEVVDDRRKAEQLWRPAARAYFPRGPQDPALTLLRVRVETAEYWDGASSRMVQLIKFARAILTGTQPDLGEHGKLTPR